VHAEEATQAAEHEPETLHQLQPLGFEACLWNASSMAHHSSLLAAPSMMI
jgi:hypothetical protein